MTSRERYRAVTHYQPFDRLFRHEMGPYPETLKRWHDEGLPRDDSYQRIAGYDRLETAPVNVGLAWGDRAAIDAMIDSKRDLILGGGYIPGCDHAIPPDISWANFLYYREKLASIA